MPALRNAPKPPARAVRLGSRILKGAAAAGGGGGTTPPTVVVYKDAYTVGSASTRVLTQRTVATGDVVAVVGQTEDFPSFSVSSLAKTAGTATIGTITKQREAGTTSHCALGLFTFTVTAGGTLTLTATFSAAPTARNTTFWTYVATGCGGVGNTAMTTSAASTVTASLATSADSYVLAIAGDWAATGGATTTLTPAGGTLDAHETDGVVDQAGTGAVMSSRGGHWADSGGAGTTSYGVTVPTSASYNLVACELLGTASGGGAPAGTVLFAAPLRRSGPHRAALGARGALAAGILAVGIGPPAVPAPDQPPSIAHPAPHRAQWRSGRGVPPGAAQQVKVPATVYARKPHGASWRGGRGSAPAALPQPFRPPVIAHPAPHRALWRGGTGVATVTVQGTGAPQPFRPPTVYSRKPHAAAWRSGQGAPPAARPQPFRPVTVYTRGAHRALWRAIAGPPPAAVQATGTPQPFRPLTVYRRAPHGAIWKAAAGRPPSAAAQPFKPATVYRRVPHAAAWRAITGRPPAAVRQPRTPATVFARTAHRSLWRRGLGSPAPPPPPFTAGALTASTAPTATQAPADRATSALGASTAPSSTLTAGDQRTGGPG